MLLGRKSYDIAMRKLGYWKMIALGLGDCSIFPCDLFHNKSNMDESLFFHILMQLIID